MGKLAILLLGVAIGSTWFTSSPATSTTVCAESARGAERPPARSEPEHHGDDLDELRGVGNELWQRIVQPMLAYATTQALDALIHLQRNVASDASGNGQSHAPPGSK